MSFHFSLSALSNPEIYYKNSIIIYETILALFIPAYRYIVIKLLL